MSPLRKLVIAWLDRPDPTAVMQTPVYKFTGYDEAQAMDAARHARTRSASGRPYRADARDRQ